MPASTIDRQSSTGDPAASLLIFGASTRAAAQSALRAGLRPVAADLFADVDLCESARVLPLRTYPDDFPRLARQAPAGPWMYTGGLENHPDLIDEIAAHRPLWGNPGRVLRQVRDPFTVCDALRSADLPAADVRPADRPPPADGSWLLKPLGGAGGSGIVEWNAAAASHPTLDRPHYFQQTLSGLPLAALFLAARGTAHLIGVTRQFVGTRSLNALPYAYCGSMGPRQVSPGLLRGIAASGRQLAQRFDLCGLFGIDLLATGEEAVLIEINPRYVASAEVLERAGGLKLLDWQRRACEGNIDKPDAGLDEELTVRGRQEISSVVAKGVLFADRDLVAPSLARLRKELNRRKIILADIPPPGAHILAGRPVCTLLVQSAAEADCLKRLGRARRYLMKHISAESYS